MVLEAKNISKSFFEKERTIKVIDNFSFSFPSTGFVCLIGESGSGKTTLLNMLSSLLKPDEGSVILLGEDIYSSKQKQLVELRSNKIGFVFQEGNLIEDLTVIDNLHFISDDENQIDDCLQKFNILSLKNVLVSKLSGGEKQRVSIARCFLKRSEVIFLDEPIANLDNKNALEVLEAIKTASKASLCLVSLHNEEAAKKYSDILIKLTGDGGYEIVKNLGKEAISFVNNNRIEPNVIKNKRIMWKFAWKNFLSRKARTILLLIISSISMIFSSLQGSVLFFNSSAAFSSALKKEDSWIIPLKQTQINEPTKEEALLKCGLNFYQNSKKEFGECVPIIAGKESKYNTTIYYVPFVEGLVINGKSINKPDLGQCVVSSFIKNIWPNSFASSISTSFSRINVSFNYAEVVDIDYSPSIMDSHIRNPNYQANNLDRFLTKYAYVIMNPNDFYSIYNSSDSLSLPGASFATEILTMKQYANFITFYSKFTNQSILNGTQINKNDDVVVSKKYLSSLGIQEKNYANFINKSFSYRDLSSSLNYVNYEQTPNIYSIKKEVTVVGITDDETSDVYVSEEFYSGICRILPYYSYQIAAISNNYSAMGSTLSKSTFESTLNFLSPIYGIAKIKGGTFSGVFITLSVLLFSLTMLIGISIGIESVSGKEKRIALLMSLGNSSSYLSKYLLLPCIILQAACYIFSSIFSLISIFVINRLLMGENALGISYSLFRLETVSIILCLSIAMISLIVSLLFVVRRISKVDIAETLKGKV